MSQTPIPFLFMRGGTSRGPYMLRKHLPEDRETLARVLAAMVGSGHSLNIDGLGGGASVTTKVAILSRSSRADSDVDYLFAQVGVEDGKVDFTPTCGNILAGVGPAAIELGLVAPAPAPAAQGRRSSGAAGGLGDISVAIRIHAVNTGARVLSRVRTRDGEALYDGDAEIDGVPGSAAPVDLQFMDTVGGVTGSLFPTGARRDVFDGIEVSCMDVAMPMVIARAEAFGKTGREAPGDLDSDTGFMARIEAVRRQAGERMGMGDVAGAVTPKFGLLSPAAGDGSACARYFVPDRCHPSLAVTGSQCLAACLLVPGTVGEGLFETPEASPVAMDIEHPSGKLRVTVEFESDGDDIQFLSAGLVRTARKLASGEAFVPRSVWDGGLAAKPGERSAA